MKRMPPTKPNPAAPEGEIVRAIRKQVDACKNIVGCYPPSAVHKARLNAYEHCLQIVQRHAARAGAGKRGGK